MIPTSPSLSIRIPSSEWTFISFFNLSGFCFWFLFSQRTEGTATLRPTSCTLGTFNPEKWKLVFTRKPVCVFLIGDSPNLQAKQKSLENRFKMNEPLIICNSLNEPPELKQNQKLNIEWVSLCNILCTYICRVKTREGFHSTKCWHRCRISRTPVVSKTRCTQHLKKKNSLRVSYKVKHTHITWSKTKAQTPREEFSWQPH